MKSLKNRLLHSTSTPSHGRIALDLGFNVLLNALDRAEQPGAALRLLWAGARRRQRLSEVSFGSCASACSRGALWRPALALLTAMAQRGRRASGPAHNAALMACSRGAAWRWTLELISDVGDADDVAALALLLAHEEVVPRRRARVDVRRAAGKRPWNSWRAASGAARALKSLNCSLYTVYA